MQCLRSDGISQACTPKSNSGIVTSRHLYLEPSSLIETFMAFQMEVFLGLFICPVYLRWRGGMDLSLFLSFLSRVLMLGGKV